MRIPLRTRSGSDAAADADAEGSTDDVSRLYGFLRAYFRQRPERGESLQRHLNQSRRGVRYDRYLAWAVTAAVSAGVLAGGAVFVAAVLSAPSGSSFVGRAVLGGVVGLAVAAVVVASGWGLALYLPWSWAETRGKRIDLLLPQAISYLYALSVGGVNVSRLVRSLADEEETYGEVAREFDQVVRDMDYFGSDPLVALRNLRDLTPSENLSTFLDDLVNTLESGGSVGEFLRAESDKYFERAQESQREFLDQLATLAELYVGAVVVGPLFLLIVLLLLSLIGADVLWILYATVYVGVPVMMGVVLLVVTRLSSQYGDVEVEPSMRATETIPGTDLDDDRFDRYRSRRRIVALRELSSRPVAYVQQRPSRVLFLSVPLGVATAVAVAVSGLATPTVTALLARPITTTTALVVAPAIAVFAPLALIHEVKNRRERRIVNRFPDFLHQLSTANEMGLNVAEALELVARRSRGDLADEIRMAANDSYWTGEFVEAIGRLADRIGSAQAARTLTLVETASRVSGDIHRVLDVAARDATNAVRLRQGRLREMGTYTLIVVISFGIYLFIVIVLDVTFLSTFADLADRVPQDTDSPIEFSRVPPDRYRMILFHSALLQAAGNGLIAGKMGEDSIRSGLKYAIGLTVLTVAAFVGVVGV